MTTQQLIFRSTFYSGYPPPTRSTYSPVWSYYKLRYDLLPVLVAKRPLGANAALYSKAMSEYLDDINYGDLKSLHQSHFPELYI